MATGGQKEIGYNLANVGTLTLQPADLDPRSIIVTREMLMITDWKTRQVHVYRRHDGMLLSTSDQLEAFPEGMCLINDMEICVALGNGRIEFMSVDDTGRIKTGKQFNLQTTFDHCNGVGRFRDKVVVCGVKKTTICWCIASLEDGHVDEVHNVCEGVWSFMTIKGTMMYISCRTYSPDSRCVYGYNIMNPRQQPFAYKPGGWWYPRGITVDDEGFLFLCDFNSILHLTDKCQPVTKYRVWIPSNSSHRAIFWDNEILYITTYDSNVIHRYKVLYPHQQDPVIPVEILRMDDKSLQLYKKALQDGKEKVYNIRVMVVGQYGVGKTTLTKRILGQPVDISVRKSTEGIDVHKHCCKISLDTGEWIVQPEDSDQLARLQRLVKLLTNQQESTEVSGELEGHREGINPNRFSDSDFSSIDDYDGTPTSLESDIHQESDVTSPALEASSVAILDKGRPLTSKDDAMMEFLQLVNEKADKLKKSIVEYATLSMWDFAGQYVFYTTHQTFLTRRAIYILVTDLCRQFTDLVRDDECYFDTEGVRLCQVQDLVEVWLNSIHCCAPSLAASTLVTSPATGVTVTSPAAGITVTSPAASITVTTPAVGTTVVSSSASASVTSPAAGITATSSAAGTTVTSPSAATTMTSPAAGITVTSPAADITVTSPDVGIPVTPPVILVGTHVDKIREDKRQEVIDMYFPQICRILKDKPALRHVVKFVPIDNTQVDHQLETLKERIFQLASEQPYWGEEVPSSWLLMEEALMKLKVSGKKIIPRSLVEELNQAASVPIKTAEQLDLFLRFQHEIGTILYFSVDELKEKIVLDPQWFIDALKSLITAETFILEKYPAIRSKWFELKDNGKLTPELIDAIWTRENYPEFCENKEHLLLVMEKLNIIAKPWSYIEDREELKEENYFLAPCMLRQKTPGEVISPKPNNQMESSSVLCYTFMDKFLPAPIFHKLIAACLAKWPIATKKKEEMRENLIFCGGCVFQLEQHHKLTLHLREYVIFLRVTRMGIKDKTPSSKLCIEVREFITTMLHKILGYLGQSLKFEYFIQCPEYNGDSINSLIPVSLLKENAEVYCDFHDHIIESCKPLKFWFEDQEQSGDGDASSASRVPSAPASDTDRFMCIAYLLVDVGSKVLRNLLHHHTVTSTCTLHQYLTNNKKSIDKLHKRNILHQSQMDIMFPPSGGSTNLESYDITLLSVLFNNIVPTLSLQEKNMIKSLREDRNEIYGHANSCKINISDYQTHWNSVSSTLMALCKQCGDPDFENEILKEIQRIQVSTIPAGSYLNILKTWFNEIQDLRSRVEALESKDTAPTSSKQVKLQ